MTPENSTPAVSTSDSVAAGIEPATRGRFESITVESRGPPLLSRSSVLTEMPCFTEVTSTDTRPSLDQSQAIQGRGAQDGHQTPGAVLR